MMQARIIKPIQYQDLKGQGKGQENFNFQEAAALLANYGFNCIRLTNDWAGADFLADHISGFTLRVQLKGRITIAKKYEKTNPYMLFPVYPNKSFQRLWCLIEHNKLIDFFKEYHPEALKSKSWLKKDKYGKEIGEYSMKNPNQDMLSALEEKHLLGSVTIQTENEISISQFES